jgi:hypothetical protein
MGWEQCSADQVEQTRTPPGWSVVARGQERGVASPHYWFSSVWVVSRGSTRCASGEVLSLTSYGTRAEASKPPVCRRCRGRALRLPRGAPIDQKSRRDPPPEQAYGAKGIRLMHQRQPSGRPRTTLLRLGSRDIVLIGFDGDGVAPAVSGTAELTQMRYLVEVVNERGFARRGDPSRRSAGRLTIGQTRRATRSCRPPPSCSRARAHSRCGLFPDCIDASTPACSSPPPTRSSLPRS